MQLSKEDGRDVVWGDHPDWETIEEKIDDTTRWSIVHSGIFKHTPSGKHYSLWWQVGATECQDEGAFEHINPDPVEVEQVEVMVTEWRNVK